MRAASRTGCASPRQYNLATLYHDGGAGLAPDYERARELYEAAATAGLPHARHNLGTSIGSLAARAGRGTDHAGGAASRCLAQIRVGGALWPALMHIQGRGVPVNVERALEILSAGRAAGASACEDCAVCSSLI